MYCTYGVQPLSSLFFSLIGNGKSSSSSICIEYVSDSREDSLAGSVVGSSNADACLRSAVAGTAKDASCLAHPPP